jgi:predicted glutamine amidotransferase
MCRLLALRSDSPISLTPYLEQFAHLAQASQAYQGHGWGMAYRLDHDRWVYYKNITPIWEDDLRQFPPADMALIHARSAFRDEGIVVENNMPFYDEHAIFVFNGHLQGVRLQVEGRIGAEKIFNCIQRLHRGDVGAALQQGTTLITKRARYVRAMNIIMTDRHRFYVSSTYAENSAYFQMVVKSGSILVICSEPLPGETGWRAIANHSFHVF